MMKEKMICNAKTGEIRRQQVAVNAHVSVDYAAEIAACKQRLAQTDYVVIKIAEGVVLREHYAHVLAERQALRERMERLVQEQKEQMA